MGGRRTGAAVTHVIAPTGHYVYDYDLSSHNRMATFAGQSARRFSKGQAFGAIRSAARAVHGLTIFVTTITPIVRN